MLTFIAASVVFAIVKTDPACHDYGNVRSAARAVLQDALALQAENGWEYGGIVYETRDHKICASKPATSEVPTALYYAYNFDRFDYAVRALYHVHPGDDELAFVFSAVDVRAACWQKLPSYLSVERGDWFEFTPNDYACMALQNTKGLWLGNLKRKF